MSSFSTFKPQDFSFRKPKPVKRFTIEPPKTKKRRPLLNASYYDIMRNDVFPFYLGEKPPSDILELLAEKFECHQSRITAWWTNWWNKNERPIAEQPTNPKMHEYLKNWISGLILDKPTNNVGSISNSSSATEPADRVEYGGAGEFNESEDDELFEYIEKQEQRFEKFIAKQGEESAASFQPTSEPVPTKSIQVSELKLTTCQAQLDQFCFESKILMESICKNVFNMSSVMNIGHCYFCKPIHQDICVSIEGHACCIKCKNLMLMMHLEYILCN